MNFRIFDSADDLVQAAARTIVQRARGGERCSIALSGGSTPRPLYELLGKAPLRDELAATPVTWAVVDERYVPFDDPQSNAGMIERTLFADGLTAGHRFLPFRTHFADPQESAGQYEREWHEAGIDHLDVAILGVGDDGHTASLFPGTSALQVEDRIAVAHFVPKVEMWRTTITKPVIRAAALRIVLAAGPSKRKIIEDVKAGNTDYPIAQVTSGELVDRAAVE